MQLQGKWLVELAEFDAGNRASVERLKAFLTRARDHYVPKFSNHAVDIERQCVFAVTTNSRALLADSTGARRFEPVEVRQIDVVAMRRDAPQILAEARAAFDAGEPWWIVDASQLADAREAQEAARITDPWEEPVTNWLATRELSADPNAPLTMRGVTIGEALACVGVLLGHQSKADSNRVARILEAAGWHRKQMRGRKGTDGHTAQQWRYVPRASLSHVVTVSQDSGGDMGDNGEAYVSCDVTDVTDVTNDNMYNTHAHTHACETGAEGTSDKRDICDSAPSAQNHGCSRVPGVRGLAKGDASPPVTAPVCRHCGRKHRGDVGCDGSRRAEA